MVLYKSKMRCFGIKWVGWFVRIRMLKKWILRSVCHVDFLYALLTLMVDLDFVLFCLINFDWCLFQFYFLIHFYLTCYLLIYFVYLRNCRKLGKKEKKTKQGNFCYLKYFHFGMNYLVFFIVLMIYFLSLILLIFKHISIIVNNMYCVT